MLSLPPIIGFDSGLLLSWYDARNRQASLQSGAAPSALTAQSRSASDSSRGPTDAVPPWDVTVERADTDQRLNAALASQTLINDQDPTLGGDDVHIDHRKLFALYQGLDKLQLIAAHAANEDTSSTLLRGLDRQFQEKVTEAFDYIADFSSTEFELSALSKEKRADAGIAVPRTLSEFTGEIAHRRPVTEALNGLTGSETFSIAVTKQGTVTNVAVDLSEITGTLTLDAVVDLTNEKLEAAGVITRLERVRIEKEEPEQEDGGEDDTSSSTDLELPPDTYGIRIAGVSTEVISFAGGDARPLLNVAGVSGRGEREAGQLVRFGDAAGSDPIMKGGPRIEMLTPSDDEDEDTSVQANASVTDSQGNVYVVGKTVTDIGAGAPVGDSDAFITKYNSAGQALWTRMLGASEEGEAVAVTVDSEDNVIVAGTVTGEADTGASGGAKDGFVTKLDGLGQTLFTRQVSPVANDGTAGVTVGADDSIYLTGYTEARLGSGLTHGGGQDATLIKLDSSGVLAYQQQFGGSGTERGAQVAVASDGNILVASVEDGNAVVRKFDDANPGTELWSIDLGSLNGGQIGGLEVDGTNVYLAGSTLAGGLDAGGSATELGSFSGSRDGFLTKITDSGTSAAADFTRYVGTGASDNVNGLTIHDGDVYLAGDTQGALNGQTLSGTRDAFVARYDASGTHIYTEQYAGREGFASAKSISVDAQGDSVLDLLGLPHGNIDYGEARTVTAQSSVRDGQYFSISVDGDRPKTITIEKDDTLRDLARKLEAELLLKGEARVRRTSEGDRLRIEGEEGVRIELFAGDGADDALKGLGLKPGVYVNEGSLLDDDDDEEAAADEPLTFGLGLESDLSLAKRSDAAHASQVLLDAMSALRKAFRDLTRDPALDALLQGPGAGNTGGRVDPAVQAQLANYQAGLARLQSIAPTTTGFF